MPVQHPSLPFDRDILQHHGQQYFELKTNLIKERGDIVNCRDGTACQLELALRCISQSMLD